MILIISSMNKSLIYLLALDEILHVDEQKIRKITPLVSDLYEVTTNLGLQKDLFGTKNDV